MTKPTKTGAGVMLDPDVIAFLTELTGTQGRSRSRVINYIIRCYAQEMATKQRVAGQALTRSIRF